jgi:hypothetical protein
MVGELTFVPGWATSADSDVWIVSLCDVCYALRGELVTYAACRSGQVQPTICCANTSTDSFRRIKICTDTASLEPWLQHDPQIADAGGRTARHEKLAGKSSAEVDGSFAENGWICSTNRPSW